MFSTTGQKKNEGDYIKLKDFSLGTHDMAILIPGKSQSLFGKWTKEQTTLMTASLHSNLISNFTCMFLFQKTLSYNPCFLTHLL